MKKDDPKFKKKSIDLAIVDYYSLEFVEYREDQGAIVKFIAQLLQKRVTINDLALQGFIMRAIRKWQLDSKIKIGLLLKMKAEDRVFHVRQMFDNLKEELTSVLEYTRGKNMLEDAIEEAFQAYVKEFSDRKSNIY